MRTLVLALVTIALLSAAPPAAAGPEIPPEKVPDACELVLGEAKCEQAREDVRDLLLCTCPPW